jgi:stage IV sporulation protein FB
MKIKINPLMIPMVAMIYFSGNTNLYILTYAVMALHESSHLIAALCIGLKPESITFSPFGVNLKLKNKIISSISDEVILYSSGPLVNGVLAIVGLILNDYTLYRINTVLMIMNLLPVIPLDGGMICMRILSYRIGQRRAKKILNTITFILSVLFLFVLNTFNKSAVVF